MKMTIGILGGMGPLATCDLFRKIVEIEEASCDQDHVRVIADSNTNIPDRTAAILHGGKDPLPEMCKSAELLMQAGADVLILPCNTAHYFYDAVVEKTGANLLHMPRETAKMLHDAGIDAAGLLATDGTTQTGVYESALTSCGVRQILPSPEKQAAVMGIIYDGVKAGVADYPTSGFLAAVEELRAAGAQTLILGCTELPLAYSMYDLHFAHIDPTLVLAVRAVQAAGGVVRADVLESMRSALR